MADKRIHTSNGEKGRAGEIGHGLHPHIFAILLQVTVELGRNIMSSLMVEFLPTFLMNMINQVTANCMLLNKQFINEFSTICRYEEVGTKA